MEKNGVVNRSDVSISGIRPDGPLPAMEPGALTDFRPPASADIFPGVGFRIKREISRPQQNVAEAFKDFELADISDHLNRLYTVDPTIRCLAGANKRLVGPACTVKVYPGDNLMVHKALDIAKPGDVLVVDARGSKANAVLGDTISMKARHRGIAGFIVDGYIRDLSGIQEMDYPVYARGGTVVGPLHRAPGEINYPVCCGGVVVNPGDIIIADNSGVVVLPQGCIEQLHVELVRHNERAAAYLEKVRKGEFSNAWVDQLLATARCEIER
jgi:RraA family protein